MSDLYEIAAFACALLSIIGLTACVGIYVLYRLEKWADDTVAYHVDAALGPETDDERDWFSSNYEGGQR